MPRSRRPLRLALPLILLFGASSARGAPDLPLLDFYREDIQRLTAAPGASRSMEAGLVNPAAWSIQKRGGLFLALDDHEADAELEDVRGALALGPLGFGVRHRGRDGADWTDYTLGLGFGTRSHTFATSYSWVRGNEDAFGESERLGSGWIWRRPWGSLGLVYVHDFADGDDLVQTDLGLRPWGPRWTVFGDLLTAQGRGDLFDEVELGVGLEANLLPGLAVAARADEAGAFSLRLSLGFGGLRPSVRSRFDEESDLSATSYAIEISEGPGLQDARPLTTQRPELHLRGAMTYRRYRFFDDRPRFMETLHRINAYAQDPTVDAVVLNLSGMRMSAANLWELRAQLAGLRARGKKVVIYFDRLSLVQYAMASVADELWMDPSGGLDLRGLTVGRSYYRNTLDKLGVGIDEWRFFTYKSALESFSRTEFSPADREQWDAWLEDAYETSVAQILEARGLGRERWDRIVDEMGDLSPQDALESGLVDQLGDFHDMRESLDDVTPRPGPDRYAEALGPVLGDPVWRGEEWGDAPRIAVLYAIGPCEMDSGIRGRALSKLIRRMREDPRVKAIVLRADSPGGDPLPSDLVAREIRETRRVKPVIVSQGQVAGSGGYWISMDGDAILASPTTLTGSIGVISGHVWDESLGEKTGVTYDHVQRGRSADYDRGPVYPLLGLSIPHRPVTEEERARVEERIRGLYEDFVAMVAAGRGLSGEEVQRIAEGRIWSGRDAVRIGLVDEIGGLWRAILRAKQAAGLEPDARIEIVEGPELGLFDVSSLRPGLIAARVLDAWRVSDGLVSTPRLDDDDRARMRRQAQRSERMDREWLPALLGGVEGERLPLLERIYLRHLLFAPLEPAVLMEPADLGGWLSVLE